MQGSKQDLAINYWLLFTEIELRNFFDITTLERFTRCDCSIDCFGALYFEAETLKDGTMPVAAFVRLLSNGEVEYGFCHPLEGRKTWPTNADHITQQLAERFREVYNDLLNG